MTENNNFTKKTNPEKIKPEGQKYVSANKINDKGDKSSPEKLANGICDLVQPRLSSPEKTRGYILDVGSGEGILKQPGKDKGYTTIGIDIEEHPTVDLITDFLALKKGQLFPSVKPVLILCNFPYHKNMLELALDKIVELFGRNIPIVFGATPRFRLCPKASSKRFKKFLDGHYPPIEGIITLADEVNNSPPFFQAEIYLFNLGLKGHWFYPYSK